MTHLIAGQVGSDKYRVACKLRLHVLLPSWVEFCWEESLNGLVSATDEAVLSKHLCLPFTGCTVTVTGLEEGTRTRVKEACQKNGGNYSGELTKGVCTHLIVGSKTSKTFLPLLPPPSSPLRGYYYLQATSTSLPSSGGCGVSLSNGSRIVSR